MNVPGRGNFGNKRYIEVIVKDFISYIGRRITFSKDFGLKVLDSVYVGRFGRSLKSEGQLFNCHTNVF